MRFHDIAMRHLLAVLLLLAAHCLLVHANRETRSASPTGPTTTPAPTIQERIAERIARNVREHPPHEAAPGETPMRPGQLRRTTYHGTGANRYFLTARGTRIAAPDRTAPAEHPEGGHHTEGGHDRPHTPPQRPAYERAHTDPNAEVWHSPNTYHTPTRHPHPERDPDAGNSVERHHGLAQVRPDTPPSPSHRHIR